jgi:hypothetical protein
MGLRKKTRENMPENVIDTMEEPGRRDRWQKRSEKETPAEESRSEKGTEEVLRSEKGTEEVLRSERNGRSLEK